MKRYTLHLLLIVAIPLFILLLLRVCLTINTTWMGEYNYPITKNDSFKSGDFYSYHGEFDAKKRIADIILIRSNYESDFWIEKGYAMPQFDFSSQFLILTPYKIKRLSRCLVANPCCDVTAEQIRFDVRGSDANCYYVYAMPIQKYHCPVE